MGHGAAATPRGGRWRIGRHAEKKRETQSGSHSGHSDLAATDPGELVLSVGLKERGLVSRTRALAAFAALPLLLPSVAAASAQTAVTCGATITTDAVLTQDLECEEGIRVEASHVTIDLQGHKLAGPPPTDQGSNAGVYVEAPMTATGEHGGDVTIRNGRITGFDKSIHVFITDYVSIRHMDVEIIDADNSPGGRVVRSTIRDNLYIRDVSDWDIIGNRFLNAYIGHQQAGGSRIQYNIFSNGGIRLEGRNNIVANNLVTGGEVFVGDVTEGSRIFENAIRRTITGIVVDGYSVDNIHISNNRVVHAERAGIDVRGRVGPGDPGIVIWGNYIRNAGDADAGYDIADGIHVSNDVRWVRIGGNTVIGSDRYAIYAPPGETIDQGGNKAFGRSLFAGIEQCIGVSCWP